MIASVYPYWIGFGLAAVLAFAALFFIWKGRGTEIAAQDFKFKGFSIGKMSAAGFVLVVAVAAGGGCIYKVATAGSTQATVHLAHITSVTNAPKLPNLSSMHSDRQRFLALGQYLQRWYNDTEISIDNGAADGVSTGDYFATITNEDRASHLPEDEIANLEGNSTSLLKVVRVEPHSSVTQLQSVSVKYASAHPGNLVSTGQSVVAVPAREIDLHDQIQKAQDDGRWAEEISLADLFLERHPNGFFAADVLFSKGYAEYKLGKYAASAATFQHFIEVYPFHESAPGARQWEAKATAKLR